jgi:hypothetical protein
VTVMMLPQLIPRGSRPWLVVPWELAR